MTSDAGRYVQSALVCILRRFALLTHFPPHVWSSLRPGAGGKQFLHLLWQRARPPLPLRTTVGSQITRRCMPEAANRLQVRRQSRGGIIAIRHNSDPRHLRPGEWRVLISRGGGAEQGASKLTILPRPGAQITGVRRPASHNNSIFLQNPIISSSPSRRAYNGRRGRTTAGSLPFVFAAGV